MHAYLNYSPMWQDRKTEKSDLTTRDQCLTIDWLVLVTYILLIFMVGFECVCKNVVYIYTTLIGVIWGANCIHYD